MIEQQRAMVLFVVDKKDPYDMLAAKYCQCKACVERRSAEAKED